MNIEILFLDDSIPRQAIFRSEIPSATIVDTAPKTIQKLEDQNWHFVFLDHDLNGEHYVDSERKDCGMEVVRWIKENKPKIDKIVCHSLNEKARKIMVTELKEAAYDAVELPFILLKQAGMYDALQKLITDYADRSQNEPAPEEP